MGMARQLKRTKLKKKNTTQISTKRENSRSKSKPRKANNVKEVVSNEDTEGMLISRMGFGHETYFGTDSLNKYYY